MPKGTPGDTAMRKQNRHTTEISLDLTRRNSYGRGKHLPQPQNFDKQSQESQDTQPVCNNGICELTWKPDSAQ